MTAGRAAGQAGEILRDLWKAGLAGPGVLLSVRWTAVATVCVLRAAIAQDSPSENKAVLRAVLKFHLCTRMI